MTDRVVIGWDGTAAAEAALEWALRHEPGCREIELVVVDDGEKAGGASADQAAERLRAARPDRPVTVTTEHGGAAEVLAAHTGPDTLLVLGGADPRTGRRRSATAFRVAAEATGPVAMVPEGFDHGRDVVLGVGDGPAAPALVLEAADQAARRGQRLVAVHAWKQFFDLDTLVDIDPQHENEVARERDVLLMTALEPVAERYPALPVSRRVLHGRPIEAVLDAARSASLLVLGRDDAPPRRGSRPVTQRAMLSSHVPVLLVPGRAGRATEVSSPARSGGSASR